MKVSRSFSVLMVLILAIPSVSFAQPTASPGFQIETIATALSGDLRGLAVAPPGFGSFGGQVFVLDNANNQLLVVDPASGTATVFATLTGSGHNFLRFAPGGAFGTDLFVSTNVSPSNPDEGIIRVVDALGNVSVFGIPDPPPGAPGFLFGGVGIDFSLSGSFGTRLYTGGSGGNIGDFLSWLPDTGGVATLFVNFGVIIGSPLGLHFGTGVSGFPSDLFVGMNSQSQVGIIEHGVFIVDANGAVTPFVTESTNAMITSGIVGLDFALGDVFGSDLYVVEISGKILAIDSSGNVDEFVSGIAGPFDLEFDGNNGLYFTESSTGTLYRVVPSSSIPVPAVSDYGMVIMCIMILIVGTLVCARRLNPT